MSKPHWYSTGLGILLWTIVQGALKMFVCTYITRSIQWYFSKDSCTQNFLFLEVSPSSQIHPFAPVLYSTKMWGSCRFRPISSDARHTHCCYTVWLKKVENWWRNEQCIQTCWSLVEAGGAIRLMCKERTLMLYFLFSLWGYMKYSLWSKNGDGLLADLKNAKFLGR